MDICQDQQQHPTMHCKGVSRVPFYSPATHLPLPFHSPSAPLPLTIRSPSAWKLGKLETWKLQNSETMPISTVFGIFLCSNLIRAKLSPKNQLNPKRQIKGMTKCKKSCLSCPYVLEGKDIKHENFKWNIKTSVNCATYNACYMLICTKERCSGKYHLYIGETVKKT